MDVNAFELIQLAVLLVPLAVTFITEILKQIAFIPVTSKNAKWAALALSVGFVLIQAYNGGALTTSNVTMYIGEIVATYAVAVGFYETLKNTFQKIEKWVKSL
jgi:hypothetical protein